jgi:hypothetical protein
MAFADAVIDAVSGAFTCAEHDAHDDETSSTRRIARRSKTLGAEPASGVAVSVVAPGGGTGMNSSVYSALARKEGFTVNILGESRASYDRYPASWSGDGCPPPNLESFGMDLASQGCLAHADCLIVGSRGGQVVLPTLWQVLGADVPPAVVMNGGCAMGLPAPVHWPSRAVTFLLLGGADYFRGRMHMEEYLDNTRHCVPEANGTTAILLVHEMVHMPQAELLLAILQHMIHAVTFWKSTAAPPQDQFHWILNKLQRGGWSGKLTYKTNSGDAWETVAFP